MRFVLVSFVMAFILSGCGDDRLPAVEDPTIKTESTPKPALELIDISKVPHLASKGRFQDGGTADGGTNQVAKDLVANGKDAIPFLIDKLDDETEMDHTIVNFWNRLSVGDMAYIILTDFFTDRSGVSSTIPGFAWDDFLERGNDKSLTGEEVLRRYIQKHGRKSIKTRWQELWDKNKDKIVWDERCYCFGRRK